MGRIDRKTFLRLSGAAVVAATTLSRVAPALADGSPEGIGNPDEFLARQLRDLQGVSADLMEFLQEFIGNPNCLGDPEVRSLLEAISAECGTVEDIVNRLLAAPCEPA